MSSLLHKFVLRKKIYKKDLYGWIPLKNILILQTLEYGLRLDTSREIYVYIFSLFNYISNFSLLTQGLFFLTLEIIKNKNSFDTIAKIFLFQKSLMDIEGKGIELHKKVRVSGIFGVRDHNKVQFPGRLYSPLGVGYFLRCWFWCIILMTRSKKVIWWCAYNVLWWCTDIFPSNLYLRSKH